MKTDLAIDPKRDVPKPSHPFRAYRDVYLRGISNEQLIAAVCEGQPVHVLYRFAGKPRELRAHISRAIGRIEREHEVFIPEWCAPMQELLIETLACPIETALFGHVQRNR